MDWNGNLRHFASRPECSYGFLYNYNYDQYQGMEMKHHQAGMVSAESTTVGLPQGTLINPSMEIKNINNNNNNNNHMSSSLISTNTYGCTSINIQDKKKRLSTDQLDSLEKSFQEEIKLDPDRKMKLSRELGLQPRQIAVWFQNRRARWKAKQLERLYDSLKQELDVMSKEKQKLQDEVMKLKAMLSEQAVNWKQVSTGGGYTEISGEETVESTSGAIRKPSKSQGTTKQHHHHHPQNMAHNDHHHIFNNNATMEDQYNHVSPPPPYWPGPMIPSYP